MNSKERVYAALKREAVDRVPISRRLVLRTTKYRIYICQSELNGQRKF